MSGLPSWWGASLPCGCVRGVKICGEAEALWDAVADAHKAIAAVTSFWGYEYRGARNAYDDALAAFSAHVEISVESAVQRTML